MNLKRKFAILAVPAVLALGGGALAAVHAATSNAPATSQPESGTESQAEDTATPGTSAAEVEKADPAGDVQSGHADTGDQVDHQSTANE